MEDRDNQYFEEGYNYAKKQLRAREISTFFCRLVGAIIIACGIISIPILENDSTAAAILIPIGMYLLLTDIKYR